MPVLNVPGPAASPPNLKPLQSIVTLLTWHDDNHLDQLRRALEGKA